ncbi:MarR family transcriptional regulator [Paenibacillus apiarius]|nr:MarR family transcriptional regulator [Paenibacillus apiarius]
MEERSMLKNRVYANLADYLHTRDRSAEFKREKALAIIEQQSEADQEAVCLHLDKLTLTQLHVLHEIGKCPDSNVTFISNHINVTKGGVSKAVAKLIAWGLVREHYRADNKKEIYYRLTTEGEKLAYVHDELHQQLENKHKDLLERYTEEELRVIASFLKDLTELNSSPL